MNDSMGMEDKTTCMCEQTWVLFGLPATVQTSYGVVTSGHVSSCTSGYL